MTRHFDFRALVLSVAGIAITGCSGEPTNVDHAAVGGTGSADNQGGSASNSGGTAGMSTTTAGRSGGTTSTGGTSGAAPNSGLIFVGSVLDADVIYAQVAARFYAGALNRCSSQTFGSCIYYTNCSLPSSYVSAGTLSVTSPATADLAANNISMVPNADNSYVTAGLSGTFAGGESVHIAASGATVPALSLDLTAPLALLVDSPAADNYGAIQASKSSDLVIQFSRGMTDVRLVALPMTFDSSTEYVECTSEPGASSLTIPKAALAVAGRVIDLLTVTTKEVVVGGFAIKASLLMNAFTPDKQHPVTIEIN